MAGLAFAAMSLGCESQILALVSVVIFMLLQGVIFFLRDDDSASLRFLAISNAIVFLIGAVMGSTLLKDVFTLGPLHWPRCFRLSVSSLS